MSRKTVRSDKAGGVWAQNKDAQEAGWSWEWPYKRIVAHRTGEDDKMEYLVKWVGRRYHASWVKKDSLIDEAREAYDKANNVAHKLDHGPRKKRRA